MVDVDLILKRFEKVKDKRVNFDSYWQETCEYFLPHKAYINRISSVGERTKEDLFDTTGRTALRYFAAGMFSSLTPATSKWFNYQINNETVKADKESQVWLATATQKTVDIMNQSNWSMQIMDAYRNFGLVGLASMFVEPDPLTKVRFRSSPIREIYICEDARGRVNARYRPFKLTVSQAYSEWGDAAGKSVVDKFNGGATEDTLEFLHVIEPRYNRVAGSMAAKDKKYASIYINIADKTIISEGGYDYFPCPTARLDKSDDSPYGYGTAMQSLPDMKELNKFHYIVVRGGIKQIDPVMFTNDNGIMLPKKVSAGALIKGSGPQSDLRAIQTGGRHDIGKDLLEMKQKDIKEQFFVNLFLALANRLETKTAYEASKIIEENKAMIAPLIMPVTSELLDPIMETVFTILLEAGEYGPIPEAIRQSATVDPLSGETMLTLGVEYTSSLARAQKMEEIGEITDLLGFVGQIAAVKPDALDKVDTDKAIDEFARLRSVNPELITDTEDANKVRQLRAQAVAQQQALMAGQAQADINATQAGAERNVRESKA